MFVADWRLGLVTLAVLPVGMIFIRLALRDYAEQRDAYDRANEQINSVIIEFVQGMQVVRTFDDGSSSFTRFRRSLDAFTQKLREVAVQQAIDQLVSNKTVIVIAQRLSTVVGADLILVLEEGRVVERGTHTELLSQQGRYAALWNVQQCAQGWRIAA